MTTKLVADLKPWDVVTMPDGQRRTVLRIEFTGRPIDSTGTNTVRVHWSDHDHPNLLAADKAFDVLTCTNIFPSLWPNVPPIRGYEDGSTVYGPYGNR